MKAEVDVVIVAWNSLADLQGLLPTLENQQGVRARIIVVDNNSTDGFQSWSLKNAHRFETIQNTDNVGFAAAANQGIDHGAAPFVFLCNPDVRLAPDFLSKLIKASQRHKAASACGKLYRFPVGQREVIDSTGMVMSRTLRHLDRGSGESDRTAFDKPAFVFGGTGAAVLLRRSSLNKVKIEDRVFDERFFAYREDADLAWRLQLAGMCCIYTPEAIGWHRRHVTPRRRSKLSPTINRLSVRNRWLLQWSNMTPLLERKTRLQRLGRNLLVIAACMTVERSSWPAFRQLRQLADTSLRRRAETLRLSTTDISHWFANAPVINEIDSE